jgi:hypothetical protein
MPLIISPSFFSFIFILYSLSGAHMGAKLLDANFGSAVNPI